MGILTGGLGSGSQQLITGGLSSATTPPTVLYYPACQWLLFGTATAPPTPLPLDFVDAVYQYLKANFGTIFAWIGPGEAPPRTQLPYIQFMEQGDDFTWSGNDSGSNQVRIDNMSLQVTLYGVGRLYTKQLGKQVANSLTDAPLAYADGTHLQISIASRTNDLDPSSSPNGIQVWSETMIFDLVAQRLL